MLSTGEGEKLKKIINIEGKTMRSSAMKGNHPALLLKIKSKFVILVLDKIIH